jgi:acyl carrier protein
MSDVSKVVIAALRDASGSAGAKPFLSDIAAGQDVPFEQLDLDSLSRFEIIMQIEEQFDIELDDDEVMEQGSVAGLIRLIEAKLAKG